MYIDFDILKQYIDEPELVNLTDDNNTGIVNIEVLNDMINSAESEVDSYLRDQYPLPLQTPVPKLIESICADITIYNLYKRRKRLDMPESISELYKSAIDNLLKIRRGVIILSLPKNQTAGNIKINKTEDDRIFPDELLDKL